MKTTIYTLKLTPFQETKLYDTWKSSQSKTPPYAKWQLRPENCVITCYTSGKTVFQGKDASVYASPFADIFELSAPAKTKTAPAFKVKNRLPQAGSTKLALAITLDQSVSVQRSSPPTRFLYWKNLAFVIQNN